MGGHLDYIPIVRSNWAGPRARVPARTPSSSETSVIGQTSSLL